MQHYDILENKRYVLFFIAIAYLFSIAVRMYWPIYFGDNEAMIVSGQLMINTNDGYYFASAARDMLNGVSQEDVQRGSAYGVSEGLVLLTVYLTKITPFSLETIILYLPAVVSSLIVVPIVLTGKLMGHTFLGFMAALLGAITWSYYNRTMIGYYDTDMFSVLMQFMIFYSFLRLVYKKDIKSIVMAAFFITLYPYFYAQGMSIVFVVFMGTVAYLLGEYMGILKIKETQHFHENKHILFGSIILLSIILMIAIPVEIRLILFILGLIALIKIDIPQKYLLYMSVVAFIGFLIFGNILQILYTQIMVYLTKGTASTGLHYYGVVQTVREAGSIPMATVANRISGSSIGLLLSLVGYILLVMKHRPFIIALPLIGVGLFAYIGGLRFTVYAVPIAALSVVYLFYTVGEYFNNKKLQIIIISLATLGMLYPNIKHVVGYKVPTVLNKAEVSDLDKLKNIASPHDYTLAWWDYGYPIWYYSDTNTLIDGGKHTKDNFIISTILQTSSSDLAANLSRLAVETYIDSNYSIVSKTLFDDLNESSEDISFLLSELESPTYQLPEKTRDIYLYLPYKMMNIFPTVMLFGNLDLKTGNPIRKTSFFPTVAIANDKGILRFNNGIYFDTTKGEIALGKQTELIKYFITTQNTNDGKIQLQSQLYHMNGNYVVVYLKSYRRFVIMDMKTFFSTYVQMFMLGKYDKNLFELVVSSPYSRIYKVKK